MTEPHAEKLPDSNDLLKLGQLPVDPMAGTTPIKVNGKKPKTDELEPPPELFEDDPNEKDHPLAGIAPKEYVRLTPSERALLLGEDLVRQACGIDTFDKQFRGGLPATKRLFFVGGPGCFKSATCIVLTVKLLLAGWHVAIIAADEPADDVLIRIGRAMGFDRDALEDRKHPYHEETKAKFAEWLSGYPLTLIDDGDDPDPTIEAVARDLRERAKDAPSCLFIDSIQTARSSAIQEADNPRAAVDAKIIALKYASDTCKHLVLATSEANRAWSSARKENRIEAIGAGAESRSIEYAAHAQIVMSPLKDEPDVVECVIAKNRLGGKRGVEFRLKWNADDHSITEIACEPEEPQKTPRPQRDKHANLMKVAIEVERYLCMHPKSSGNQVRADVNARDADIIAALDWLHQAGRIVWEKGPNNSRVWSATDKSMDEHSKESGT